MTYEKAVEYILETPKFAKKTTKENLLELLNRLGNPHLQIKTIHVAGTNGKGSTCAYMESILRKNKNKVGLFTSPHLVNINERIKVNNIDITNQEFLTVFHLVKEQIDAMVEDGFFHVSFFELLFVMAACYFAREKVTYGIFETGLGGRLDATNVLEPEICVITSIGIDHMEYLGDTIESISGEKAGIIKPNAPVVYLGNDPVVERVITDKCYQSMSQMFPVYKRELTIHRIRQNRIDFSYETGYYKYEKLSIFTYGTYQVENAALAVNAIRVLIPNIEQRMIEEGLHEMNWPGRMELLETGVIADGAHNANAVEQFVQSINEHSIDGKYILLFAVVGDKDYKTMIDKLVKNLRFSHIIITTIEGKRGIISDMTTDFFKESVGAKVEMIADIETAYETAKGYRREDDICLCVGSLYLVGYLKQLINR